MSPTSSPAPPGFSRRTLLAASAAGLALLVAGCTSAAGRRAGRRSPSKQADALAAQVGVQEALVAAYAAAGAADPALAGRGGRAGRPGRRAARAGCRRPPPARRRVGVAAAPPAPPGRDARAWLRGQVAAAADLARHRLPWTSRARGRRCSDRSPRACAARTGDWRDATMADDDAGALDRGTENAALREALAAEHAAIWGYGVVGAALGPDAPRQPAAAAEAAHRDVRDQVTALLAGRKADAGRRRRAAYALPFPVLSAVDAAALGVVLEDGVAAAWVRVLDQAAAADDPGAGRRPAQRRRGARRRLARPPPARRRSPARCPGLPPASRAAAQRRAPRKASVTGRRSPLD